MAVNPAVVAAIASARLPALEVLELTYRWRRHGVVEPPPHGAPGLQLITAAPWFPQLRRLGVHAYNEPPGDVCATATPHLTSLEWAPERRNDTSDTVAALGRVLASATALRELRLCLLPGPGQPALTRAALATLLAAPGLASALEELTLRSGVRHGDVPPSAHPLAALAAARLPALRSLAVREFPGASRGFAAALGAAPWAPQLTHLGMSSDSMSLLGVMMGEAPQARAAAAALAAAPLTSLRELDFGMWLLPLEAMRVVVRAPWFGGLESIAMNGAAHSDQSALCAASPAYAALYERGHKALLSRLGVD